MTELRPCPVCHGVCALFDVVDLNKSCEDQAAAPLPLAGEAIYYARCADCGFCFAPQMWQWSMAEFAARIYNADYLLVDPHYLDARPRASAADLIGLFGGAAATLRHLDYGGGHGLLSRLLNDAGWTSQSYDPYIDAGLDLASAGRYDLITAYEVFEHVSDIDDLMARLATLLAPGGMVLFSTLLSDGHLAPGQRLSWWYAAPRNGHISLYSRASLQLLAGRNGWTLGSFSDAFHVFFTDIPPWAAHVFNPVGA